MWLDAGWLLLGILLAAAGGELFVRAAVGLAAHLRVSHALIGSTVTAFATSAPELSVAVNAGLAGTPRIALGDALGSNVVNIGLILGLSLLVRASQAERGDLNRNLAAISIATVVVLLLGLDGRLGRIDACVLLTVFATWLVLTVRAGRVTAEPSARLRPGRLHRSLGAGVVGLLLLMVAGTYVVEGAVGLGTHFGLDPFLLGAVLVAFGTSTPELATTVVAKLRGHDEIALGNILGSNIFNIALVAPTAALIHPIQINRAEVGLALGFGLGLAVALLPPASNRLGRNRGLLLLVLYGTYLWTLTALGLAY